MRALGVLLRKEFLQIRRDATILRLIFVMPMIQLLVLANAASFEVKESRIWVVDRDRSVESRGLIERLEGTGRFRVVGASVSDADAMDAVLARDADAIVGLPIGFARELQRTRMASVQFAFNAEDGAQAGVASSYALEVLQRYGRELGATLQPRVVAPQLDLAQRNWYNPALDYRWFMVPGILVQLVTIAGTMMTSLNIVREKEAGTLDQLNVTPIARGTFIAAKLLPFWIIAMTQLTGGLLLARFLFGMPIEGPLGLVYLAAGIYLVAALGIGLWISSVAETQQQALFVAFSLMLVYILMSGLFTPIRSMPDWAQWVAALNPLSHFIALMRAVLLKGAGPLEVLWQLGALLLASAFIMTFAVRQYRKGGA